MRAIRVVALVALMVATAGYVGCRRTSEDSREVVVYTSVDQVYASQIAQRFTEKTGIAARLLTDTEAGKTTGLYRRLLAEKDRPRADVFWNGEICRTIQLAGEGLADDLSALVPSDIPRRWVDPEGQWVAFSLRARVLVYSTNVIQPDDLPRTLEELTDEAWRGKVVMANPLFGTTATHMAALYAAWGDEKTDRFIKALKANDLRLVDGNAMVRDVVARGEAPIGLTDTDDVFAGIEDDMPISFILLDQDGMGTFAVPNTVMRVRGGPNPEEAKAFIRFLLSPEVEELLARSRARQLPVRVSVPRPDELKTYADLKAMDVSYREVAERMESTARRVEEILLN